MKISPLLQFVVPRLQRKFPVAAAADLPTQPNIAKMPPRGRTKGPEMTR